MELGLHFFFQLVLGEEPHAVGCVEHKAAYNWKVLWILVSFAWLIIYKSLCMIEGALVNLANVVSVNSVLFY